jgi:hypothetical protein
MLCCAVNRLLPLQQMQFALCCQLTPRQQCSVMPPCCSVPCRLLHTLFATGTAQAPF